jgi:hypothetical protein
MCRMPLLVIDADTQSLLLRLFVGMLTAALGAASYRFYNRRSPILDDEALLKTLTAEQRMRLELGLVDSGPVTTTDPLNPVVISNPELRAKAMELLAGGRSGAGAAEVSPAELAAQREHSGTVLRAKWERLLEQISALGGDPGGASWLTLLQGEHGVYASLSDLSAAVAEAREQPPCPVIAFQLEGPLATIARVLGDAETVATEPSGADASRERIRIVGFLENELSTIERNIASTA